MQPAPDEVSRHLLSLEFQACPAAVRDALRRMLLRPPLSTLSDEGRGTAELVLAEVLNNVAEHAYPDRPGPVTVTLRQVPHGVSCLIVDQGAAMPGGKLPAGRLPDTPGLALDELPEGGFGWHLIRSLTLDLHYARAGGCNQLRFVLPDAG